MIVIDKTQGGLVMNSEMQRELLELFEEIDSTLEEAKSLLVSVKKVSSFPESKGIAVKIPIKRQPSAAFEKTIYEPIPMGIEHKTVQPIEKKQDYNSLQDTIVLPPKIQLDNDLKENLVLLILQIYQHYRTDPNPQTQQHLCLNY